MSVDVGRTRLVGDVVRRVKRTFGDEAGVQITTSDIFDWINDGQREIAENQKINKTKLAANIVKGQGFYVLTGAEMLQVEDVQVEGRPLPYLPLEEAASTIMQEEPYKASGVDAILFDILKGQPTKEGTPQFWTLDMAPLQEFTAQGTLPLLIAPEQDENTYPSIFIWPVPDTAIPRGLTVTFIRMPKPVEDETDNLTIPDKYFNALVYYVLAQAYELDEDHDASLMKKQEFENALLGYINESEEQRTRTYPLTTYYDEGW